jgi:hypothetical protein
VKPINPRNRVVSTSRNRVGEATHKSSVWVSPRQNRVGKPHNQIVWETTNQNRVSDIDKIVVGEPHNQKLW